MNSLADCKIWAYSCYIHRLECCSSSQGPEPRIQSTRHPGFYPEHFFYSTVRKLVKHLCGSSISNPGRPFILLQIAIANPNRQVHLLLSKAGIIDMIGAGWCFVRVHDAVQVCLQHVQSSSSNSIKLSPQGSENLTDSPKAQQRHGFLRNLWRAQDGNGSAGDEAQSLLRQNLV
jgi:hypothetical protein